MPAVNTEAMNEHLAEISTQVAPDAHCLLLCDGAGWHQPGERLIVPGNITLMPLPSYAPELNPMENVWDYLRGNKLSGLVWDGYDAIMTACEDAWNFFVNDPDCIVSIGTRDWHRSKVKAPGIILIHRECVRRALVGVCLLVVAQQPDRLEKASVDHMRKGRTAKFPAVSTEVLNPAN